MTNRINIPGSYSFYGFGNFDVDFCAGYIKVITKYSQSEYANAKSWKVVFYDKAYDFAVLTPLLEDR